MKRIAHATLATGALIVTLALWLSACSTLGALVGPVIGDQASDKTRAYAEYVFVGFNKVWLPILKTYRALPECGLGVKAPCYEERIYRPLYVATDAATACQVAATEPGVDILSLSACIGKVNDAKLEFTQNGLAPKSEVAP